MEVKNKIQTIEWHPFPDTTPPKLGWGQYLRYLVATKEGLVFECSWLHNEWHQNHDGVSDRTKQVTWWAEKPMAPYTED